MIFLLSENSGQRFLQFLEASGSYGLNQVHFTSRNQERDLKSEDRSGDIRKNLVYLNCSVYRGKLFATQQYIKERIQVRSGIEQ
jgi:hypothetical protein